MHAGCNNGNYWLAQNGNCDLPSVLPKTNGIAPPISNNNCRPLPNGAQSMPRNEQYLPHTGNFTSNQISSNCHNYGAVQHGIPPSGPSWPPSNYHGSNTVCPAYANMHNPIQPQMMCNYAGQHHCENGYPIHYKAPEVNYPPDFVARNNYMQKSSEYDKRAKINGSVQRGSSKLRIKDVYALNGVPNSAVGNNVYQPGMEHTCPLNYLPGQSRIDHNQMPKNYEQVDMSPYRHYNGRLQQYDVPVNNLREPVMLGNSVQQAAQKSITWVPESQFNNEQVRRTVNDPAINNSCVPHLEKRKCIQKTLTATLHAETANNTSVSNKRAKTGNSVTTSSRTIENSNVQVTEETNYVSRRVEKTTTDNQNLTASNTLLSAMLQSKSTTYDNLLVQKAKQLNVEVNGTLNQSASSNGLNNLPSFSANADTNVSSHRNPSTQSATLRKENGLVARDVPQNHDNISTCDPSRHLTLTNTDDSTANNQNPPPLSLNVNHDEKNTITDPRYENISPCEAPPPSAGVITSVSKNTSDLVVNKTVCEGSKTVDEQNEQSKSHNEVTILPQSDADDPDVLFLEKKSREFQTNEKSKEIERDSMSKCQVKLTDCLVRKKKESFINEEEKSKSVNKNDYNLKYRQTSEENDGKVEKQSFKEHKETSEIIETQRSVTTKSNINNSTQEKNQYSIVPVRKPGPKSKTMLTELQNTNDSIIEFKKDNDLDLIRKDAGIEVQVEFQRTHNTYRTKINREKLGMLIEFLESDSKPENTGREFMGGFHTKNQKDLDRSDKIKINKQSVVKSRDSSAETLACRKPPCLAIANCSPDKVIMLKNAPREKPQKAESFKFNEADSSIPLMENKKDCISHNKNTESKSNPENTLLKSNPIINEIIDEDEVKIIETDKKISSTGETPDSEKRVSSSSGEKAFNRADEASIIKTIKAFQKIQRHHCISCNINSSSDYFWINVASGELRCLNCFKKMADDDASKSNPEVDLEIIESKIPEQKLDIARKKKDRSDDKLKRRMSLPSVLEKNEMKDENIEKRSKPTASLTDRERRKSEEKHRKHYDKETTTLLKNNYTKSDFPFTEKMKVLTDKEHNYDRSLPFERKKEYCISKQSTTDRSGENKSRDKEKKPSEGKSKEREKYKHSTRDAGERKRQEELSPVRNIFQKEGSDFELHESTEESLKEDSDRKLKKAKGNNKNEILAQLYKKTKKLSWNLLSEP